MKPVFLPHEFYYCKRITGPGPGRLVHKLSQLPFHGDFHWEEVPA